MWPADSQAHGQHSKSSGSPVGHITSDKVGESGKLQMSVASHIRSSISVPCDIVKFLHDMKFVALCMWSQQDIDSERKPITLPEITNKTKRHNPENVACCGAHVDLKYADSKVSCSQCVINVDNGNFRFKNPSENDPCSMSWWSDPGISLRIFEWVHTLCVHCHPAMDQKMALQGQKSLKKGRIHYASLNECVKTYGVVVVVAAIVMMKSLHGDSQTL